MAASCQGMRDSGRRTEVRRTIEVEIRESVLLEQRRGVGCGVRREQRSGR